jgi:hypothetical protein
MKRFLAFLMFVATLASAQEFITVTPVVGSTAIADVVVTPGNDTITVAASGFAGIYAGQAIYGVGIPYGTTVKKAVDTSTTIVMSAVATQGSAAKILNFGVLDANLVGYGTGDWFGLPFRVYQNTGQGGAKTLVSVVITENADVLGNTDLVLFNAYSDTLGQDTVAVAIRAVDAPKIVGYVSLSTAVDLGTARMLQSANIQLNVPKENLYGRLIAKSTMLPTSISGVKVKFGFR